MREVSCFCVFVAVFVCLLGRIVVLFHVSSVRLMKEDWVRYSRLAFPNRRVPGPGLLRVLPGSKSTQIARLAKLETQKGKGTASDGEQDRR